MDVTKDPRYPKTPELDKFLVVLDTYNTIAMFLDWAADEKIMHVSNAPKMICEYLEVDWEAMESERAAVLDYIHGKYPVDGSPLNDLPSVTMAVTVGDEPPEVFNG
jgi:hypothetical protein